MTPMTPITPMTRASWLGYALATTLMWGVWGAFTGLPSENGFPDSLTYVVWAATMIVPAAWAMRRVGWKLQRDPRSLMLGGVIGLLGAGGQLLVFHAVTIGPAYLIFPIISVSPAITVVLSYLLLGERTGRLGVAGIALALLSLPLFDYAPEGTHGAYGTWFVLALLVLVAWGLQAFFIKLAHATLDAEGIFFYMTATGLVLVPVALAMTDFSHPVNTGFSGPWLAALIQMLNSVGALTLVYAFRRGKAIIVAPLINAGAPLLTAVISVAVVGVHPAPTKIAAVVLALLSAVLLAMQPE